MNEKMQDRLENLAEEIRINFGLKVEVNYNKLDISTIFGKMEFKPGFPTMMEDFYRFIYCYGGKLSTYGIESRINQASK
jgi:hypothetical protein